MTWQFEIAGDAWVLGQLSEALQSDEIRLVSSNGTFSLVGRAFDGIAEERAARKIAEEKLNRLSGLAMLTLQLRSPLQIKSVTQIDDNGRAISFITTVHIATLETHLSWTVTDQEGRVISVSPSPDIIRSNLNAADTFKAVDKVLRLLGTGDLGWVNLYRLYEIVRNDVGGDKGILSRGWSRAEELKLFKRTANHPEASGDNARHGSLHNIPPQTPMDLSKAQALVRFIVQKWLEAKR